MQSLRLSQMQTHMIIFALGYFILFYFILFYYSFGSSFRTPHAMFSYFTFCWGFRHQWPQGKQQTTITKRNTQRPTWATRASQRLRDAMRSLSKPLHGVSAVASCIWSGASPVQCVRVCCLSTTSAEFCSKHCVRTRADVGALVQWGGDLPKEKKNQAFWVNIAEHR